ncbi:suppressor of fused domain protein [Vibrio harveyi]|uniref:suppressor of fused domain protein n=1 Tax=Vibrio harveyi TaxID=669 RepID=UPI0036F2A799
MTSIFDYYRAMYGEPAREAEYKSPEGALVQIFKWDESQTDEGVTMYATLGANRNLGDSTESCEFFIGMMPEADSIADALAEIALHGNGTTDIPNSGDTTTLAYELWSGTKAKTFMFTDGDEIISPIKNEFGKQIWFIQLVPLFEKELAYKKEHGEEALWEKFEESEVPYWDSSRGDSLG